MVVSFTFESTPLCSYTADHL